VFQEGETLIGTEDAEVKQDIVLNGLGIEAEHCSVVLKDGIATLIPHQQAQCWVNTVLVDKPTRLSQGKHNYDLGSQMSTWFTSYINISLISV
jgi:kinesin family protein 16B